MTRLPAEAASERRTGVTYALVAYTLWGLFPIYFKALGETPPLHVLAHRVVWSALFLALLLGVQRRLFTLLRAASSPALLARTLISASLLAANWFIYIWAVAHGRVVDASLGYFITPLVSVSLGVLLLGERLRPGQVLSIALAASGVGWLTWQFGELPWVGLSLAASFGTYGALRKTGSLGSLDGLMLEQALLLPLALGFLSWQGVQAESAITGDVWLPLLLVCAGPLSALPLGLFAAGARLIPLSLAGLLQYVSPSIQLALGLWLWHEPFNANKFAGYLLIWLAVLAYSLEGFYVSRSAEATRHANSE